MQQKKDSSGTTFYKNILPGNFFFNLVPKVSFSRLGHVSNKVNRGIVQKPDKVGR